MLSGIGCSGFATFRVVFFNALANVLRNFDHCLSLDVASGVLTRLDARSTSAHMQVNVNDDVSAYGVRAGSNASANILHDSSTDDQPVEAWIYLL